MAGIFWHVPDSTPAGIGGIDEYTVLMMHMEEGDWGNTIHDISGGVTLNTATKKMGATSMQFDGSSYSWVPDHSDWTLGTVFTIECWVYITAPGNFNYLMSQDQDNNNKWAFGVTTTDHIVMNLKSGGSWSTPEPLSTGTVAANEWVHIAAVSDGSNLKFYNNGTLDGTFSVRDFPNMSSTLRIGAGYDSWRFTGYVDGLRVSNTARYLTNFTPASTEFVSDVNTKLLPIFTGDVSAGTHNITAVDDAQFNTTTSKFDRTMYFDGDQDYVSIPDHVDWDFGTGDFTIDLWMKPGRFADQYETLLSSLNGSDETFIGRWRSGVNGGRMFVRSVSPSLITATYDFAWSADVWYHIAIVRYNNTVDLYVDGVAQSLYSGTKDFTGYNFRFLNGISIVRWTSVNSFQGYIDELRISKGIARWTTDFDPAEGPYTE